MQQPTEQGRIKREVNELGLPYYLQAMNAATPEALMLKIIFQMLRALAYKLDLKVDEVNMLNTHSAIFELAASQKKIN